MLASNDGELARLLSAASHDRGPTHDVNSHPGPNFEADVSHLPASSPLSGVSCQPCARVVSFDGVLVASQVCEAGAPDFIRMHELTCNYASIGHNTAHKDIPTTPNVPITSKSRITSDPIGKLGFLEVFCGVGGLSREMRALDGKYVTLHMPGIDSSQGPWFLDLTRSDDVAKLVEVNRSGQVHYAHFGTPCKSFSRAVRAPFQHRSKSNPMGSDATESIRLGNILARVTYQPILELEAQGAFWSIENPSSSYLWQLPEFVGLRASRRVQVVSFDMCRHGGKLEGAFYKKFIKSCPMPPSSIRSVSNASIHIHILDCNGVAALMGRQSIVRVLLVSTLIFCARVGRIVPPHFCQRGILKACAVGGASCCAF